jgi:hypothetical protein
MPVGQKIDVRIVLKPERQHWTSRMSVAAVESYEHRDFTALKTFANPVTLRSEIHTSSPALHGRRHERASAPAAGASFHLEAFTLHLVVRHEEVLDLRDEISAQIAQLMN